MLFGDLVSFEKGVNGRYYSQILDSVDFNENALLEEEQEDQSDL